MTPHDARDAARRKFGNITLVREDIYQMNTIALVDSAWRDLKYGARLLRLNPGFRHCRDPLAGARRRREHRDFSAARRCPPSDAAGENPQQLVEVRIDGSDPHGRTGQFSGPAAELTNPLWEQIRDRQQAFSGVLRPGASTTST